MLLQVKAEVEAIGVDVGALRHTEDTLEADALLTCRTQQQQQQHQQQCEAEMTHTITFA
jgi:hypothetical protein